MGKFFLRFFLIFFIIFVLLTIYLSYFGIKTNKFDNLIKNKTNEINKYVKLEFQETKIHLNLKKFNLVVKLQNPKFLIKNNEINLSKLALFLPLRSFISSDFLLKRTEISFADNDIKDLTKITNIFLPSIINKQLSRIFAKGNLEGEFIIPFTNKGKIDKDFKFEGKILNADININKDFQIKNLTTEIKFGRGTDDKINKEINFVIKKGSILNLELLRSSAKIKLKKKDKEIILKIHTKGNSSYQEIKKIFSLFKLDIKNIKDIDVVSNLITTVNLSINDKFRIVNPNYFVKGQINNLRLEHKKVTSIKKFLPSYNSKFILKNTEINFVSTRKESPSKLKLKGLINFDKDFEDFQLEFSGKGKKFSTFGKLNLNGLNVTIHKLNYKKQKNTKANVSFSILINKLGYDVKNFLYSEDKTKIDLTNLKLNKNFEIKDVKLSKIKTFSNKIKNNDFLITKNKKKDNQIIIEGKIFDAQPFLESLYKTSDKKTFSKDFSNKLKINISKIITGTNDDLSDFSMIAKINKGSYEKMSLKGNFSDDEILEMSIYQADENKKVLQVFSDRAKPFINNFDFIKGFEEGKLEYESILSKEGSKSNLIITDFKVSKVPALAQLLTLASLQGIADTLNGEGIRFDSFEMKSHSKKNILNIEDALAMGPAVSILLSGYVDKKKTVSLRGTLVPATKLNSIIASIPLVGDILVGKKTGEGVVGVSFKMKGSPKDIKTTVNPVKTLTPRFIVRAVEKMKRKKKEEIK